MTQPEQDQSFERLLEHLKRTRGFDFTGYKRPSLARRMQKRMDGVGVSSYDEYLDYLEVHPDEFPQLFDTLLINVTDFFRDREAWDALRDVHLPKLLERKGQSSPIRIWSAGCASGEEAYSLVILLAEALGEEAFKARVKVYATDADEAALAHGRQATYPARDLENVPDDLRERYFEQVGGTYLFRQDLRRFVIFGRHDLVSDAPISHLDLLACRNTLMYFNREVQGRILGNFRFALREDGYLFLGRAEMMRSHGDLFTPVDIRARLFTPTAKPSLRDRLVLLGTEEREEPDREMARQVRLREAALDAEPTAQIVVDSGGSVAIINRPARGMFGLTPGDVGRPLQDLRISFVPVELRSHIEEVSSSRRGVAIEGVDAHLLSGQRCRLDVQLTPLMEIDGTLLGVSICFIEVTGFHRLQQDLQNANQELETAYEELQSTNEELETTNEELETTNEELQSTVEELETTNEELQSTNEELETMNEELQSMNEELTGMNDELRKRTMQLDELNGYLDSILSSLRTAVVVVDRNLDVRLWSRRAEDLWGLRADEVLGRSFMSLDSGLPVDQLRGSIRACLDAPERFQEVRLDAINRRGKPIECRVVCTTPGPADSEPRGVVLLMEDRAPAEG